MKVVKTQKDELNAVLTLTLERGDFQPKVDEVLTNYRKKANIPGFRKGQVPMGLVKKQYGMAVLVEEVNKLLQQEMGQYLQEEKLALLGNPLPVDKPIDWQAEQLSFDFEVGLSPEFDLDLKTKKAITHYQIVADKKMLDDQIDRIKKQFGTVAPAEQSSKTAEIKGTFVLESAEINNQTTLLFDQLKSKKAQTAFLGAKVGDVLSFETKGLFEEDFVYARAFGKKSEEV
ncbi:MAG TPA: trigger factor, partial [Flavobacteriaceae bacterium]|nr:trigger factor [Flavobacteriaceae bacterium]